MQQMDQQGSVPHQGPS